MASNNQLKQLYDRDFNLWIEQTKQRLEERDFENVDWENLIEEIDDVGKSQKRSLESYLELLIAHILKLRYWEEEKKRNQKHWQVEVVNFRNRIARLLKQNPSFKSYMKQVYPDIFRDTVKSWQIEFEIEDDCYIELERILSEGYFG